MCIVYIETIAVRCVHRIYRDRYFDVKSYGENFTLTFILSLCLDSFELSLKSVQ